MKEQQCNEGTSPKTATGLSAPISGQMRRRISATIPCAPTRKPNRRVLARELTFIRANYLKMNDAEMAAVIGNGITAGGVRWQRRYYGMKRPRVGLLHPKCIAARFTKGRKKLKHTPGLPYKRKADKDGYVWFVGTGSRRKLWHRELWERNRGPVPRGYIIRFKDGNRGNVSLDNLECISRGENARRNMQALTAEQRSNRGQRIWQTRHARSRAKAYTDFTPYQFAA